jgi:hypothetical protein
MDVQSVSRWVAAGCAAAGLSLSANVLLADTVTLNGGGSVKGFVTSSSKSVSVRTSTGGVIVFDRSAVKHISRGHVTSKSVAKAGATPAKAETKKHKLTPAEDAWMPKVRGLVSRLYGGDQNRSRMARETLRNIDDSDAIPALSSQLGSSRREESRHLYVLILHGIKGPKPVYYLVALSLFDPSPAIRSDARKAFRDEQLDSARMLYIDALRSGSPPLARMAAIGLGEIGDPRGDSVPYLINSLVTYGTVASLRQRPELGVVYTTLVYPTPGLKLSDNTSSGVPDRALSSGVQTASATRSAADTGTPTSVVGLVAGPVAAGSLNGQPPQDLIPNSSGTNGLPATASSPFASSPMGVDTYEQPIAAKAPCSHSHYDKPLSGEVDHPEVLDALLKITGQEHPGYGFNRDRWRSWWAGERTNRDLQKPLTADRTLH